MASSYPGLTAERFHELEEMGLTPDLIDKFNKREVAKLDDIINAMTLERRDQISASIKELRLVIVGKTGAGKSSLGNLIIGRESFKASHNSESYTSTIKKASCEVDNIRVTLIDTPGTVDTKNDADSFVTEIAKVFANFSNGIHGFLFVFNHGNPRYTAEEKKAFKQIEEQSSLGKNFLDHCFVVITNGLNLYSKTNLTAYLEEEKSTDLGNLLNNTLRKKVIAVENSEKTEYGRSEQQLQVIRMIAANVNGVYTNEAMDKSKEDQEATAAKFRGKARELIPEIQDAVHDEVNELPHEKIKDMSSAEKTAVADSALTKVMRHPKAPSDQSGRSDIRDAINVSTTDTITRLTDINFRQLVDHFAFSLLVAAGVISLVVLTAIAPLLVVGTVVVAGAVAVGAAAVAGTAAVASAGKAAVGAISSKAKGFFNYMFGN